MDVTADGGGGLDGAHVGFFDKDFDGLAAEEAHFTFVESTA